MAPTCAGTEDSSYDVWARGVAVCGALRLHVPEARASAVAIRFVRMRRCVDYYVGTRKLAVPVAQSYYRHGRRDPEAPLMGLCVLCLRLAMQSV